MSSGNKVLVVGSGGREHAICWKLAQSDLVEKVFISPGNSGIGDENKVFVVDLNVTNYEEVGNWCKKNNINLVVVGPENYLADGIVDELDKIGIPCFGPKKDAAKIETDKSWAKSFMSRHNIPTARWKSFTNSTEAKKFVHEAPFRALVIKAAGLAAGKGVIVAKNNEEACAAIDEILVDKKFGSAGDTVIVEEILEGQEVSMLAFTDGKTVVSMAPSQDHKTIFDDDKGSNTGGMGAYCPCLLVSPEECEIIKSQVLQRVIDGFSNENLKFTGVIYAGLMLTQDGFKVLEFNCRFGDPETQVILPLLKSDLFVIMKSCCEGTLTSQHVLWRSNIFAVGVILASKGYPESSSKGQVIKGVEEIILRKDHSIFYSAITKSKSGELLTNGGRVLITVALAPSLALAAAKATAAARHIQFEGKQFRTDIAHKGVASSILQCGQTTYKSSGVDINAGDQLVSTIKSKVSSSFRNGVIGSIGGFGGLFDLKAAGYKDPILVSGTDGVGTKVKIAIDYKKYDTIGIDLVAMCVNDVLANGAEPLFFLDYFACGRLNVENAAAVINGVVDGCKLAGCALIGGETAEMPDIYGIDDYDLAGFAVGAVERKEVLPKTNEIKPHDIVIGLPSSGLHSNGFSLVRKIMKLTKAKYSDKAPFSLTGKTFGDELLTATKIYAKQLVPLLRLNLIKAFAHITGGGLLDNIPRVLPDGFGVTLDATKWNILPVFGWLATVGEIEKNEMLRTFNCGIGGIIICSAENSHKVLDMLQSENATVIGEVHSISGEEHKVHVKNFEKSMGYEMKKYVKPFIENLSKPIKRVGVLISGSGTNLQALINAIKDPTFDLNAEIVLVISNKSGVEGLKRAEKEGIPTKVLKHSEFSTREAFDEEMDKYLRKAGVDIICLAGFMRILSSKFVQKWRGALINIHPSLLPSFKGADAHRDVLQSGVRISGCTVHFVAAEVDSGAIIEQAAVPVYHDDTIETLQLRIKTVEHSVYPNALKLLANDKIKLRDDNSIEWIN